MGRKFVESAIRNRKITIFLVILIMIWGLYNYYIIPKQEDPDLNAPVAMIVTTYPGASPDEVEKSVTRKIEEELATLEGYGYANSYSKDNVSIVLVRLDYGTDIDKAWSDLRIKMDQLQNKLPEGCHEIEINTELVDTAGMILAVSGENYSFEQLEGYTEVLKKGLEKIKGISRLEVDGTDEKEVIVVVDVEKLNTSSLSLENIIDIIKSHNIKIPSGRVNKDSEKLNVTITGTFQSLRELKDIIISVNSSNGNVTRLKDIADIKIQSKETNQLIRHNDRKTILLSGYFDSNENIVLIGDKISYEIERIIEELPEDITISKVLYQSEEVNKSVNRFLLSLVEGILFVILVVFVGMGYRNAIIVSTAIPISILITFCVMNLLGIKIHQISIAALIVALGMLVDNAIVISDAIQNRINEYENKLEACIDGVREVAMPVFTSTLTTCGAFLPLLLLSSIAGEYISSIPKIVIISLFASYIVAVLVVPTMAYIFFKKKNVKNRKYKVRKLFNGLLKIGIKRPLIIVLLVLIGIWGAVITVVDLGLQFFPKADKNLLYIDVKADRNINAEYTDRAVDSITKILNKQPEVINITSVTGGGLPKFFNSIPIVTDSPDIAQILLEIDLDKGDRFSNNYQLTDYLQEKLDSEMKYGSATVKQLEIGEPIGSPVRLRLTGENVDDLIETKELIKTILSEVPGTTNINDDYSEKKEELNVDIKREKVSHFGLTMYDIHSEINFALMGGKSSVFKGDKEMDIVVKSNIDRIEKLKDFQIKSKVTSQKVLLSDVGEVISKEKVTSIHKYDRDYAILVTSDVKEGYNSVAIQNELSSRLEDINLKNVEIAFDGEREKIQENFGSIGALAVFSVVVIYVILLFQFKSFIQPLVILLTIPLSGIGSIFGIYLFKQPLSFTAVFGMVSLLGIVVNNAIVLIDCINSELKKGMSIKDACISATDQRFRPIILSSITTLMGLIPLVFSGSELFRPMAISLMSGLMVSSLLTLVIIPVVYYHVSSEKDKSIKS